MTMTDMNTSLRRLLAAALALLAAAAAAAAEKPGIAVEELTLPNGMRWLLFERHESPTVTAGFVARVGSVNERPGITGLSHFFEHMMFKGTRVIGTKDAALDLRLIAEQEKVQAGMREEMALMRERLRRGEIADLASPESKTARYLDLEQRFLALVQEQRKNIVKDELDQIYTKNGAEGLNASTWEDMTLYYVKVPSPKLELWAWLESDRLLHPVFREFYSERDVVFEERRLRIESTPLGKYDEAFNALFWEAHSYRWPVVGWPSDIPTYTKAQADDYFATYYAPNNLTGALVGDFKTADAKALLARYFGRIPRGPANPSQVVTLEPPQLGEKRYDATAETSPTVRIWWHAVPFVHRDRTALDLLSDLMSGRTGRLYKGLVRGRQLANEVSATVDLKKQAGIFEVECVVKDGKDPAAAEAAVYEEIEGLQREAVPEAELQKVKNQAKANAYRRLASPQAIQLQLLYYEGLGDWTYVNTYADEVNAVTGAEIQRVAKAYFKKETRSVGTFLRKAAVTDGGGR